MNPRNRDEQRTPEPQTQLTSNGTDQDIRINGLEQVIEMLRYADPHFRASLLRRLQARDPGLAQKLLRIIR
jgi:hypothetical protein